MPQKLVAKSAIEAFHIAVLPGAPKFDVGCLDADGSKPVLDRLCDELRPVVRADVMVQLSDSKRSSAYDNP